MAKQDRSMADNKEMTEDLAERLQRYRGRIDQLDKEIVRLLNDRASCALELGRCKTEAGLETYQPQREVAVLEHARTENRGPLGPEAITRLFERIIDENRRLERIAEEK
tara:strand:- start:198 stop:524 length:327 start_codon:yes stop_codon:yes gene_type:complete